MKIDKINKHPVELNSELWKAHKEFAETGNSTKLQELDFWDLIMSQTPETIQALAHKYNMSNIRSNEDFYWQINDIQRMEEITKELAK